MAGLGDMAPTVMLHMSQSRGLSYVHRGCCHYRSNLTLLTLSSTIYSTNGQSLCLSPAILFLRRSLAIRSTSCLSLPDYRNMTAIDAVTSKLDKSGKIFVAGHRGLVGSAIVRRLRTVGYNNLILRSHTELDLTNQSAVKTFFSLEKPQYVILAAAKVGGIHANSTYPADFITINLQIQTNVIDSAYRYESSLLTGPLEPTNEWYAIAKIAGIKMCQAYRIQHNWDAISAMPTNLYGPNDNFHPENSHVLPALMRRFHEAKVTGGKEVVVWGSGAALREFLHVDDLADSVVFLLENYSDLGHVNVGSGKEVSIKELAEMVKEVVGFEGEIVWDKSKPDGTPRKLMDCSTIVKMGWEPKISLRDGLVGTYE
ncbi:unnamed protein product [Lactuca saligna]|uniref:GDP-L-fucose synthase n=1 Tax=Lactuca saligna TaxID=75948 RepID=A0AA35VB56_LACSI|nr:unnamed protein product [Lactuca saligna]